MSFREKILNSLRLVFEWHKHWVNPRTQLLHYQYDPQLNQFWEENCPIRLLGAAWDLATLGNFLQKRELEFVVDKSIDHYCHIARWKSAQDWECGKLESNVLGEPSCIAHSAFLILALTEAKNEFLSDKFELVSVLSNGIVAQQREDGSYKISFEKEKDYGEELYAGEAMLALMHAYLFIKDKKYMDSVERAFYFYSQLKVAQDVLPFFANWQCQASKLLFMCTEDEQLSKSIQTFGTELQDRLINLHFFEKIRKWPKNYATVEVACALEGLTDTYFMLEKEDYNRRHFYTNAIRTCVSFLLNVQNKSPSDHNAKGGFGASLLHHTQRVDVTGHASNAFIKVLQDMSIQLER